MTRNGSCHQHEGISQSLRQAMFAGCPVIAMDVGGSAEVIRHGETGLLVPPRNVVRLAEAIRQTLCDRDAVSAMARRGHEFVEAHHTREQMGQLLLAIYARHLDRPAGS